MRKIKRLTDSQNDWLKTYADETGFEPMFLDSLRDGTMTFNEAARRNIDWYEDHAADAFNTISKDVPYDERPATETGCRFCDAGTTHTEALCENKHR